MNAGADSASTRSYPQEPISLENRNVPSGDEPGIDQGLAVGIGVVVGVMIGLTMDNLILGIAIGIILGLFIGPISKLIINRK